MSSSDNLGEPPSGPIIDAPYSDVHAPQSLQSIAEAPIADNQDNARTTRGDTARSSAFTRGSTSPVKQQDATTRRSSSVITGSVSQQPPPPASFSLHPGEEVSNAAAAAAGEQEQEQEEAPAIVRRKSVKVTDEVEPLPCVCERPFADDQDVNKLGRVGCAGCERTLIGSGALCGFCFGQFFFHQCPFMGCVVGNWDGMGSRSFKLHMVLFLLHMLLLFWHERMTASIVLGTDPAFVLMHSVTGNGRLKFLDPSIEVQEQAKEEEEDEEVTMAQVMQVEDFTFGNECEAVTNPEAAKKAEAETAMKKSSQSEQKGKAEAGAEATEAEAAQESEEGKAQAEGGAEDATGASASAPGPAPAFLEVEAKGVDVGAEGVDVGASAAKWSSGGKSNWLAGKGRQELESELEHVEESDEADEEVDSPHHWPAFAEVGGGAAKTFVERGASEDEDAGKENSNKPAAEAANPNQPVAVVPVVKPEAEPLPVETGGRMKSKIIGLLTPWESYNAQMNFDGQTIELSDGHEFALSGDGVAAFHFYATLGFAALQFAIFLIQSLHFLVYWKPRKFSRTTSGGRVGAAGGAAGTSVLGQPVRGAQSPSKSPSKRAGQSATEPIVLAGNGQGSAEAATDSSLDV